MFLSSLLFFPLIDHPLRRRSVLSVDVDPDALAIARENIASMEMEDEIELLQAQIGSLAPPASSGAKASASSVDASSSSAPPIPAFDPASLGREFDTVVMNPPFGTWNQGIDMVFLEVACQVRPLSAFLHHVTHSHHPHLSPPPSRLPKPLYTPFTNLAPENLSSKRPRR